MNKLSMSYRMTAWWILGNMHLLFFTYLRKGSTQLFSTFYIPEPSKLGATRRGVLVESERRQRAVLSNRNHREEDFSHNVQKINVNRK